MDVQRFRGLVRGRLDEIGQSPITAARQAGLPRDAIRSVFRGHPPSLERAAAIAAALGLELTIGPPRGPRAVPEGPPAAPSAPAPGADSGDVAGRSTAPGDVAGVPVEDRRLAEMLAVLADEFEALNPRGQESLCTRFWAAYPDLRERALAGQGRRLARLAGGLGARDRDR